LGTATATSGINVSPSATLAIDNGTATSASAISISNRFGGTNNPHTSPDLNLNGSNVTLTGSTTPGVVTTETLGNINLAGGNSVITSNSGTGLNAGMIVNVVGNTNNSLGILNPAAGATVNFISTTSALGSLTNQILFAGFTPNTDSRLVNGILPYA